MINSNSKLKIQVPLLALCLTLVACGGGGGSESSSANLNAGSSSRPSSSSSSGSALPSEGGSESGEAEPAPASQTSVLTTTNPSFTPDETRLAAAAENSTQLYVAESFNFDDFKRLALSVDAVDSTGNVLANKLLKIKSINKNINQWDDAELPDAQLLFIGKTDSLGHFNSNIEVPLHVQKIVLELNAVGVENKVMLDITENNEVSVSYSFR